MKIAPDKYAQVCSLVYLKGVTVCKGPYKLDPCEMIVPIPSLIHRKYSRNLIGQRTVDEQKCLPTLDEFK